MTGEQPTVIHRSTALTIDELAEAVGLWLQRHRGWVGEMSHVRMQLTETAAGGKVLLVEFDHSPAVAERAER